MLIPLFRAPEQSCANQHHSVVYAFWTTGSVCSFVSASVLQHLFAIIVHNLDFSVNLENIFTLIKPPKSMSGVAFLDCQNFPARSKPSKPLCIPVSFTLSLFCVFVQLQSLSHNVIFTLDSLLKGDLKGVKGVRFTVRLFPSRTLVLFPSPLGSKWSRADASSARR